jgi:hypothetical protein
MEILNKTDSFKEYINSIIKDPIVKILLENSSLTKVQLETILTDLYHRENKESINQENKLSIRRVSRGAFNRTRKQGIKNIVKSIYTVFVLGYIGLLETDQINPFIEISYRLKTLKENLKYYDNYELADDLLKNLILEVEELASGKNYYK